MNAVLDVAIGLAFLYLLLALIATTAQELLATLAGFRARHLYASLREMLGKARADALYDHPLIRNLCQKVGSKSPRPSYIPRKAFALALLDVLQRNGSLSQIAGVAKGLADAEELATKIELDPVKRTILLFLKHVDAQVSNADSAAETLSVQVERWFDDRMARASGWYKRSAQIWSLLIAGAIVVASNADSIYAARRLWDDAALRETVAASARAYAAAHESLPGATPGDDPVAASRILTERLVAQTKALRSEGFPIGWQRTAKQTAWDWFLMIIGLLMSTLAVSLGSGFWFDVLSKVLQLRGTGVKIPAKQDA